MFRDNHYVPVLRPKPAEMAALRTLGIQAKRVTTPLLEFPASGFSSTEDGLNCVRNVATSIGVAWRGRRIFADLTGLPAAGDHPLTLLASLSRQADVNVVPVIRPRLFETPEYLSAVRGVVAVNGGGLCLRVGLELIRAKSLEPFLAQLLEIHRVSPSSVDLVVDRGLVSSGGVTFSEIAHLVPAVDEWRSITVLGGSFPRDLTGMLPGHHRLPRVEWQDWKNDRLASQRRRPAFGDYTIQHPRYFQPPAFANFSASVRYASDDYWLVLRGEGVRNPESAGYAQWPAHALMLIDLPEFMGASYSAGDSYVATIASDQTKTGNATTWLTAGISHHLTLAAQLVAQVGQADETAAESSSASEEHTVQDRPAQQ